jgi:hypothetical protein
MFFYKNTVTSWSQDSQPVLRIRDVYPGSQIPDPDCPSRISDPGSKSETKEKGEKKFVVLPFLVATNLTK